MDIFKQLQQRRKFQRSIRDEIRHMDRSEDVISVSNLVDRICARQGIEESLERQLVRELASEICRRRYRR